MECVEEFLGDFDRFLKIIYRRILKAIPGKNHRCILIKIHMQIAGIITTKNAVVTPGEILVKVPTPR